MFQSTQIIGRVGSIESASTASGTPVIELSVVTTKSLKQDDGSFKEFEEWHRVKGFNKIAESAAQKVAKGDLLLLNNLDLRTRTYRVQNEASDRYITELVMTEFPRKLPKYYTKAVAGTQTPAGNPQQHNGQQRARQPAAQSQYGDVDV